MSAQGKEKRGAVAGFALAPYITAVALDNALYGRQADPGARKF